MRRDTILPIDLDDFAPLRASSVALLTSYRRNGQGVGTLVGISIRGDRVYFTTWHTTGKVKRLANNPQVTLAPCTRAGKPTGAAISGIARRLDSVEAEQLRARLGDSLWGKLWRLIYRLRGWQPIMYEVKPAVEAR